MLLALKNQRRHVTPADIIKPSADKRETLRRQIFYGGEKSSLPLNHGLTVCWSVEATSSA